MLNQNVARAGVYKFYININKYGKIPFFLLVKSLHKSILKLSLNNKYNNITMHIVAAQSFEFSTFFYFDLKFDNQYMYCNSLSLSFNPSSLNQHYVIDNYQGEVSFIFKSPVKQSIKEGQSFASISFYVKQPGKNITASIINVKDEKYKYQPVEERFSVNGNLLGDINRDGIVNIKDFDVEKSSFAVSYKSGQFDSWYDLNLDGIIDGKDLSILEFLVMNSQTPYVVEKDCGILPNTFVVNEDKTRCSITTGFQTPEEYKIRCIYGSFVYYNKSEFEYIDVSNNICVERIVKRANSRVYYFVNFNNDGPTNSELCNSINLHFLLSPVDPYIYFINYGLLTNTGIIYCNSRLLKFKTIN